MRYIRTKDGEIFDTEVNGAWEKNDGTIGIPTINGIVVIPKEFIIKQADTIEELCDKFVIVYQLKDRVGHTDIGTFPYAKEFLNVAKAERLKRELFGGVWTKKGFTYVARLNDNNELDLDVSSARLY